MMATMQRWSREGLGRMKTIILSISSVSRPRLEFLCCKVKSVFHILVASIPQVIVNVIPIKYKQITLHCPSGSGARHNADYIFTSNGLSEKIHGRYSLVKACNFRNVILIYKHDKADVYLSNNNNTWVVGTEKEILLRRPMSTWSWLVPRDGWSHKVGEVWTFDHSIRVTSVKSTQYKLNMQQKSRSIN